MKLLHIIPSIDPKGGGPMEGVKQHGKMANEFGHNLEVVTLDDPREDFVTNFPLKVYALGPAKTSYSYTPNLAPWLLSHAREYDAIYINGLWQYHGFGSWRVLSRMKVPYFVFTHGMLDPWFKHTYPLKHLKKWLYWPWAEYRLLRDAQAVFFTCEEERILARKSFWLYKVREQVINYGTNTPPNNIKELKAMFFETYQHLKEKRVLLFLSRIHEKKGCDLLISAFANVVKQDERLHLVMAGPCHNGLIDNLKAQANQLGISHRVTWTGMLQGDIKWGAFYASEAFVLPSHQENFGIAVAEALGCGLPVLISDKVNIWREIQQDGVGIVNSDNIEGTLKTLQQWLDLDEASRNKMAQKAKSTFEKHFTIQAMSESIIEKTKFFLTA